MAYIPDPLDASQPTGDVKASTAAAEFRALKARTNALSVGNTAVAAAAAVSASAAAASALAAQQLVASVAATFGGVGYFPPVAYGAGLDMSLAAQTVTYLGQTYAPIISFLPFTTSGTFEAAKFRVIQGVVASDLAASTGSGLLGHIATGVGSILRWVRDKLRESPSVDDYGADPTGVLNSSPAFMAALAANQDVSATGALYRLDSMIELNSNKTLRVRGGTVLKRMTAFSASTDPVVWIKASDATLKGAGKSSVIRSENRSPRGVVSLGHKDNTESHADVLYCTVDKLTIGGALGYGQTSGAPDVALYMACPLIGYKASFFHDVTSLRLEDANIGLWLQGDANANTIRGIQGVRLGNTTFPTPNRNAFFFNQGSLDNTVSDCFFHQSPDTPALLVDHFDNTGVPGGRLHTQQANSWKGMMFEQGGTVEVGLKALVAYGGCHYELMSNCAGGDSLAAGFLDNNWLISYGRTTNNFLALAGTQSVRAGVSALKAPVLYERFMRLPSMTEGITYKVVTMSMSKNASAALVTIDFSTDSDYGLTFQGAGTVTYEVRRDPAGNLAATAIISRYTGFCRPCVPIFSVNDVILSFVVFNNSSGTSPVTLLASARVVSMTEPTFWETPTSIGTAGTPLANNI